ncbi:hypothetical protein SLE2022_041420 [Rubroshorea leprosula]
MVAFVPKLRNAAAFFFQSIACFYELGVMFEIPNQIKEVSSVIEIPGKVELVEGLILQIHTPSNILCSRPRF